MDFSSHPDSDIVVFAQVQTFHDPSPCTVRYTDIRSQEHIHAPEFDCSNVGGIPGSPNAVPVCCSASCGTCGGSGCGAWSTTAGLPSGACCVGGESHGITSMNIPCVGGGTAPCTVQVPHEVSGGLSLFVEDASCGATTAADGIHGPTCCLGVDSHTGARPARRSESYAQPASHPRLFVCMPVRWLTCVPLLVSQGGCPCDCEGCIYVVESLAYMV